MKLGNQIKSNIWNKLPSIPRGIDGNLWNKLYFQITDKATSKIWYYVDNQLHLQIETPLRDLVCNEVWIQLSSNI